MLEGLSKSEIELAEFIVELNDLTNKGILKQPEDYLLWLEDVEGECNYCFDELSDIINQQIKDNLKREEN